MSCVSLCFGFSELDGYLNFVGSCQTLSYISKYLAFFVNPFSFKFLLATSFHAIILTLTDKALLFLLPIYPTYFSISRTCLEYICRNSKLYYIVCFFVNMTSSYIHYFGKTYTYNITKSLD